MWGCSIFPTQYAVDIHGYVLVYSIDSLKSFEIIQILYDKIVDMVGDPKVPVVLVGNKKDLEVFNNFKIKIYVHLIIRVKERWLGKMERILQNS